MIVADVNLIAQLLLRMDQTEKAQAVYRRDPDWCMPDLWRHEFLNVLANYLRFDTVSYSKVSLAWKNAMGIFANASQPVDMLLALRIAAERNVSAYDAQYLALAHSLKVPLVTEDRALLRAAPGIAISIAHFLAA